MNSEKYSMFEEIPENPLNAMINWLEDARDKGVLDPQAVALATANASGIASNRIVKILEISEDGLVFATHSNSPKGLDIKATHWGSCVFYWPQVKRQIIVSGAINPLPNDKSDVLWKERPKESHAMSIVSTQSAVLHDEMELRKKALALTHSAPLKRPRTWSGYRQEIYTVEFWEFSPDRLYKRIKYTSESIGWRTARLQP